MQKRLKPAAWLRILVIVAASCLLFGSNWLAGVDTVVLNNKSNHEVGVFVDGATSGCGGEVNDIVHQTTANSVDVGTLDSSPNSNTVVAFNEDRALTIIENANWTSGSDQVTVDFSDPVIFPVAIWVVYGDFNDRFWQAYSGLEMAWYNFVDDAVGIDIQLIDSRDATGFNNISDFYDFTQNSDKEDWKNGVGFTPGAINIYMVKTVDGETWKARGVNFQEVIVYGETAVEELMVHEIGHCLNLRHTDTDPANFDSTNVMWPLSDLYLRDQITEGQIFRMHTDVNSSMNWWIGARPNLPQFDCPHGTVSAECPSVWKRIWADNTFPPN